MFNIVGSTIKEEPNDEFINGLTKILCVCLPFVLMFIPNLYEDMENYLTNAMMFIHNPLTKCCGNFQCFSNANACTHANQWQTTMV
jgi:hypothetical protein